MEYAIEVLKQHQKTIERMVRNDNLMLVDMSQATKELHKMTQLKRAIKILKLKNKKL